MKVNINTFEGENYSPWKTRVLMLLDELELLDVIENPPPAPVTEEWNKRDKAAKHAIMQYLSDSFINFASREYTAKRVLEKLDETYEVKSVQSQLSLRRRLLGLKLQSGTALKDHLKEYEKIISDLIASGARVEEADKISHLFMTLPKSYDSIVTALEASTNEQLNLSFVKKKLLDYELKLKCAEPEDTGTSTGAAKALHVESAEKRQHNNDNSKPSWKSKRGKFSKFGKKNKNKECKYCHKFGHWKKDCYALQKKNGRKNQSNNNNQGNGSYNNQNSGEQMKTAQTARRGVIQVDPLAVSPDRQSPGYIYMVAKENSRSETLARDKIAFILDSGATDHLINRADLAKDFTSLEQPLKFTVARKAAYIAATKRGNLNVISNMGVAGILRNVYYCADIPHNLLSVSRLQEQGYIITFGRDGVTISKDNKVIVRGNNVHDLTTVIFKINISNVKSEAHVYNVSKANYTLWHKRLGHIGASKFKELQKGKMCHDFQLIERIVPDDNLCEDCINGKQTRNSFNKSKDKSYVNRPLYNVHSDVAGYYVETKDGKRYFVTFIDEYTHYCATYLIAQKSDVFSKFKDFVLKSESHFNTKVVNLYIDNGREYLSNEIKDFCADRGISFHLTVPRTPQLNGVAERMNRTIGERARAMLSDSKLHESFWGDAVLTATYLINRSPTKALTQAKTPYEMWHGRKPYLKYLKVFGSTVYIHNKLMNSKFDKRSTKGILVGYEPNGYRVWDVERARYVIVRDVIVDEINYLESRPPVSSVPRGTINIQESQVDNSDFISQPKSVEFGVPLVCKPVDNQPGISGIVSPPRNSNENFNKISKVNTDSDISHAKSHTQNASSGGEYETPLRRSERLKNRDPVNSIFIKIMFYAHSQLKLKFQLALLIYKILNKKLSGKKLLMKN